MQTRAPATKTNPQNRPGTVREIVGIAFQSDTLSILGVWIIRPIESIDRRVAGLGRTLHAPPLAIHAGVHVRLEDGREFVVEQLFGNPREDFVDGLNWTPIDAFRARDHRGWDVTVRAEAFRNVDEAAMREAIDFLNRIQGRPFFGEDCTTFVERVFNKRRLFADSPTSRLLGFGLRVGDPALPLLRPDAKLDPRTERLLRADTLKQLPDPTSSYSSPNWRTRARNFLKLGVAVALAVAAYRYRRRVRTTHHPRPV